MIMMRWLVLRLPVAAGVEELHCTGQQHVRACFWSAGTPRVARARKRQHLLTVRAQRLFGRGTGHAGMAERFEIWSNALVGVLSMSVGRGQVRGSACR